MIGERYLYKARLVGSKKWVTGHYAMSGRRHTIITSEQEYYTEDAEKRKGNELVPIDPTTICQCTGLIDKNETLIWENDIVLINNGSIDEEDGYFMVKWDVDAVRYVMNGEGLTVDFDNVYGHEIEVCGNRFENPGLLEVTN